MFYAGDTLVHLLTSPISSVQQTHDDLLRVRAFDELKDRIRVAEWLVAAEQVDRRILRWLYRGDWY
jgi:hypothetical protein